MCKKINKLFYFLEKEKMLPLFHCACAYKQNMLLLVKYPNVFGPDAIGFSPMVVSGALAIELFLKLLKAIETYKNNKKPYFRKVHELNCLFNDLDSSTRTNILKHLSLANHSNEEVKHFLKKHGSDFVEYRYLFNKNEYKADMVLTVKIAVVLYSIAQKEINQIVFNPSGIISSTYDSVIEKIAKDELFYCDQKDSE